MGNKLFPAGAKRYDAGTEQFLYYVPPEECLIGELPDELWLRVFKFFSMRDLIVVQFTCRRLAELGRDNTLWSPFCRKYIVDRQEGIRLARRRRMALFEAALEQEELRFKMTNQREKEKEKEGERDSEEKKRTVRDGDLGLSGDDSGWVLVEKDDPTPKLTGRAKEREDRRKEEEARKNAARNAKNKNEKEEGTGKTKIAAPWWGEYTVEEELIEKRRGLGEKPLWKEVFVAWKIARDHNMLHRCQNCSKYYYEKDNATKSCWYHPGEKNSFPSHYRTDETAYSCCGGESDTRGCKSGKHKSSLAVGLSEFED